MTIRELKELIDRRIEMYEKANFPGQLDRMLDKEVVVKTYDPSVGCTSANKVTKAGFGIDWDAGRFILYTENKLIKKKDDE